MRSVAAFEIERINLVRRRFSQGRISVFGTIFAVDSLYRAESAVGIITICFYIYLCYLPTFIRKVCCVKYLYYEQP